MQQCTYRCRRYHGVGKPGMKRRKCRLDAESQKETHVTGKKHDKLVVVRTSKMTEIHDSPGKKLRSLVMLKTSSMPRSTSVAPENE